MENNTITLIKKWCVWWCTNESEPNDKEFRKTLDTLPFRTERTADCLSFARETWDLSIAGFKSATDRLDKLLSAVLLATGWILTSAKKSFGLFDRCLWALCAICFILSVVTLLLGRWKVQTRAPVEFDEFVRLANNRRKEEKCEWEFEQARQFALAAHQMQEATKLVQVRLLASIVLFIIGLLIFASRSV